MKKLISLLLAVSVMAASTVASAAALKAGGQRNPGAANVEGVATGNSDYLRDYSNVPFQLAVYRPGDTLTFSNDSTKMYEGDVITFISSKLSETDLNSATVMFIDQVTADSDSPSYSYKIREGLAEGIYKMDIKIGDQEVDTFYYSVADPKVEIVYTDEAETTQTYYSAWNDTTYYFASATIGTDDVTYNQAGVAEYGFDFGNGNVFTFDAATFDAAQDTQEVEGTVNWFFSIGITGIGAEGTAPVADGTIIDE